MKRATIATIATLILCYRFCIRLNINHSTYSTRFMLHTLHPTQSQWKCAQYQISPMLMSFLLEENCVYALGEFYVFLSTVNLDEYISLEYFSWMSVVLELLFVIHVNLKVLTEHILKYIKHIHWLVYTVYSHWKFQRSFLSMGNQSIFIVCTY